MKGWIGKTTPATAAAVGFAGSAAYLWATREPVGYKFDPSCLDQQSYAHPVSFFVRFG